MYARLAGRCLLALLPLACASSFAQEAFTRQAANVRAGPDRSYPLVAELGPGAPLRVMGCLEDWSWCDVAFDDSRGWVYGPFLLYAVPGDRVSLYTYGPSLGIAIVGFSLGGYWDDHYRQRPWYGGRADWERRSPPPHHAPAGLPPHAAYTPGMHPDRGEARPPGRSSGNGPPRGEQHAPAPAAQGAVTHDDTRGGASHAGAQPQREAPRPMQHAPLQQQVPMQQHEGQPQRPPAQQHEAPQQRPPAQQQHEPAQQRPPMQQHQPEPQREPPQQHAPAQGRESGAQRGPERGGGEKGGGEPERERR